MSHEIRTPLNAIVGYSELLSRPEKDQDDAVVWTHHLRRSSAHLLSLVNDILDLSKIEAGKMKARIQRHSLLEILKDVVSLMRPQASEKLLSLEVEVLDEVPEKIETDAVRLRQILVNLVSNAVKFTDQGGVLIRLSTVFRGANGEPVLVVEVEDSGIGISEEQLERIFRPFTQIRTANLEPSEGTGLGLDISARMAHLIGGQLSVTSKKGKGSIFRLEIGVGSAEDPRMMHDASVDFSDDSDCHSEVAPVLLSGCRVLVVDDGITNQRIFRFVLEAAGAHVETADDGEAGVVKAFAAMDSGASFHVILMDIQMPVMDGLEATRLLRNRGLTSPVIAITAYATLEDRERSLEAGCCEFVTKPIIPDQLVAVVARHVEVASIQSNRSRVGPSTVSTMVDDSRFAPLLRVYLDDIPTVIEEIESCYARTDHEGLLRGVHQLKGTARSYGFPELGQLAEHCQDLLRSGDALEDMSNSVGELLCHLKSLVD
jgi:CheY-like chemotaxis protein/HPt (histidine-containing phosphotransfer) domain-containing protein/two-component sensor histidine kinase